MVFSFVVWQAYLIQTKPFTSYIQELEGLYSNKGEPGVRKNCLIGYSATTIFESYPAQISCEPWLKVFINQVLK